MAAITEKPQVVNIAVNIKDNLLLKLSKPIFLGSMINMETTLK